MHETDQLIETLKAQLEATEQKAERLRNAIAEMENLFSSSLSLVAAPAKKEKRERKKKQFSSARLRDEIIYTFNTTAARLDAIELRDGILLRNPEYGLGSQTVQLRAMELVADGLLKLVDGKFEVQFPEAV